MTTPRDVALAVFRAFETGDREAIESLLAPSFTFSAPLDPLLDRDGFFARCWPNHEALAAFSPVRVVESGDEVVVTYEATRRDDTRFRNTEVLTVVDGQVVRTEVYFGWDLPQD